MSKPKPQFQPSNVLLVEVPPQFIALCEASGASPQAALRGMAAMLCGLRYDADNRSTAPPRKLHPGAGGVCARESRRVVVSAANPTNAEVVILQRMWCAPKRSPQP